MRVVERPLQVPFHEPYITEEEILAVTEVLKSGWLTTGFKTREFEAEFARYLGAGYAVAVNSCTAALHLALEAIGLKEGDEVITTPMTFAATAEVIRYFNARPVFADIFPRTMNIDPCEVERAVTEKTRAVIPVHFAGLPCEMDEIIDVAKKTGIKVIEDAAHAFPASYRGRPVGTLGDITCFSFYATKNITTGEGGMAVTENAGWADRMRIMSLHGISRDAWKRNMAGGSWKYEIISPGFKYNMTDIAAALGLVQLKKAGFLLERRRDIARRYTESFQGMEELETPAQGAGSGHGWHLYVLRLNTNALPIDRDRFIEELKKEGVQASVHFIPLHMHPCYRDLYGFKPEDFPIASSEYARSVSLPLYPKMTGTEVEAVIDAVKRVVWRSRRGAR